jgi:hypothetical protein
MRCHPNRFRPGGRAANPRRSLGASMSRLPTSAFRPWRYIPHTHARPSGRGHVRQRGRSRQHGDGDMIRQGVDADPHVLALRSQRCPNSYSNEFSRRLQPRRSPAGWNAGNVPSPSLAAGGPSLRFEVWPDRSSTRQSRAIPPCGEPSPNSRNASRRDRPNDSSVTSATAAGAAPDLCHRDGKVEQLLLTRRIRQAAFDPLALAGVSGLD